MDISKITDINELKALAYDVVVQIETQQQNMKIIQTRMQQLEEEEEKDVKPKGKKDA